MDPAQKAQTTEIPLVYALSGPLLAFGAWFPLLPDGRSFWRWGVDLCREFGWSMIISLLGAATPFVLGAAMTLCFVFAYKRWLKSTEICEQVIRYVVCLMMGHSVLFAGQMWWNDIGIASGAFLGVALVSGAALAVKHAQRSALAPDGHQVHSRLFVRWGCVLVSAASAWARLQSLGAVHFGWGVEVMLSACALTVWALSGPASRNKDADPESRTPTL